MARILIVDDDRDVRGLLRLILQIAGHQVLEAADGVEALCFLRSVGVDLVFCDLFMDGKDGLQTIREARRDFPGVPVVAMSGGGLGGKVDLLGIARLLGATLTLRKPFARQEALDAVEQALPRGAPVGGA
jgi:CheY-like chemotaxis protein